MPAPWASTSAEAIWMPISSADATLTERPLANSRNVLPSMNS